MDNPSDTPRLAFRRLGPDDIDLLLGLDSDPEVMRYLTGGVARTREHEERVVSRVLAEYERGVPGRWLAFHRPDGEFVGWFALDSDTSPADERELGYRLRRTAWGRGLGTEGSRALLDFGFGRLGLRRIWAQTMAVNAGSRGVMTRLGMRYVRTFHPHFDDPIPGTEHGEVEYELLAGEWQAAVDAER